LLRVFLQSSRYSLHTSSLTTFISDERFGLVDKIHRRLAGKKHTISEKDSNLLRRYPHQLPLVVPVYSVPLSLHPLVSRCHYYRQEIKNQNREAGCGGMLFTLSIVISVNLCRCWNHVYGDCASFFFPPLFVIIYLKQTMSLGYVRVILQVFCICTVCATCNVISLVKYVLYFFISGSRGGAVVCTNRKVAGSIPDGIMGIFPASLWSWGRLSL
jgi:hypothetical protein